MASYIYSFRSFGFYIILVFPARMPLAIEVGHAGWDKSLNGELFWL